MPPSHLVTFWSSQIQISCATYRGRGSEGETQQEDDLVNEPEVVADQDDSSLVGLDSVSQGVDGLHVKMVGGLVEQHHVRHLPGEPGEDDAALLSVTELLDRGRLGLAGDAVTSDHLGQEHE